MLGGSRAKIARATNSPSTILRINSGAAGGHIRQAQCKGAAPACPERSRGKHSEAEGRANQMKFDIFDKRPAKSIDKSHTYGLYLL